MGELSYQPANKLAYLESALRSACEQSLRGMEVIVI